MVAGHSRNTVLEIDIHGIDDTLERLCMMFVQTQHKLVNMNVDRVYETEPIYWG
jgi:hypothetical protein